MKGDLYMGIMQFELRRATDAAVPFGPRSLIGD